MSEKNTIEQLQAMSDGELAELTARVRGWTVRKGFIYDENGKVPTDSSHRLLMLVGASSVAENWYWNPAADIAQAYGLLRWARRYGLKFEITVDSFERIAVFPPRRSNFTILGNDARDMCYAFVLAMQEVSNDQSI